MTIALKVIKPVQAELTEITYYCPVQLTYDLPDWKSSMINRLSKHLSSEDY